MEKLNVQSNQELIAFCVENGMFELPCDAAAVPKTSPLGLQLFARAAGKCAGAPESISHQSAKEAVAEAASQLGLDAIIEREARKWLEGGRLDRR